MDILLWILAVIVFIIIGVPASLMFAILALYAIFLAFYVVIILIVGVMCIPISLIDRLAGKNKEDNESISNEIK